jgi:arsenate reductase (thioredoxin)
MKKRVLFVCIHNSARSQMAEAFMNKLAGDRFEAESAGIEPGKLNPVVVKAMQEKGIDLAGRPTKSVDSMIARGPYFDFVVTVCDETSAERCPIFPGTGARLHWSFSDPSSFQGTDEEKLARTRIVRDEIRHRIEDWIAQPVTR